MASKNIYKLPFDEKLNFSPEPAPFHYESKSLINAVDFAMNVGTPVLAALEGKVWEVIDEYGEGRSDKSFLDKCNFVAIKHANEEYSLYVHLKKGILVKEGDAVKQGDVIGYSGISGFNTYPHLHFDIRNDKWQTIPIKFKIRNKIKVLKSPSYY